MKNSNLFIMLCVAGVLTAIGCSPVTFSNSATNCTVSSPCAVGANGTDLVSQSQLFSATNQVDILVVDDNSGSMQTEQKNLSSPLNGFISNLTSSGLDWQIGVTSTDVCTQSDQGSNFCPSGDFGADGTLMGPVGSSPAFGSASYIIKPGSNASSLFSSTVQRGTQTGSGDERGVYALNLAIDHKDSNNAGFFRANSNLAVVILSDEDERSVGGDASQSNDQGYAALAPYDLPQTFTNKVVTTFGGAKQLLVNSIIIKPGDTTLYPDPNEGNAMTTCLNLQAHQPPDYTAHTGQVYQQLALATNGAVGSICDNGSGAFAKVLSNIVTFIQAQAVSKTMTLNYIPTSIVSVTCSPNDGSCATSNWTWTPGTNYITFTNRPKAGVNVTVSYYFDMSKQNYTSSQKVQINPRSLQIQLTPPELSDILYPMHD